jgi:hypothetical protein
VHSPAKTVAILGLARLGITRLGYAPRRSTRPTYGVSEYGPRYAYAVDYTVVPYNEEEDVAGQLTLEIEQGASFTHTIIYTQRNGQPVDLSGCVAKMQIRETRELDGAHVATLASYPIGGGDPTPWFEAITITEEEGKIEINLSAVDTATLTPGAYFYDLLVTFPSTEVRRIIEGAIEIDPGVTA